ncbi:MAG TPA: hypothetical protein VGK30_00625 [Candidatus Binatia bacterium]|jgi:hypothetical protein
MRGRAHAATEVRDTTIDDDVARRTTTMTETARVCATFRTRAYGRTARAVAAVCSALAGIDLLLLLAALRLATDPPLMPLDVIQLFLLGCAAPAGVAWAIGRAAEAVVEVDGDDVVVQRRAQRIEVPSGAIAQVRPWWLPLPAPGVTLRLRSGRTLPYGIALADPASLVAALGELAGVADVPPATDPRLVYAKARAPYRTRQRWYRVLAKFVLFALVPTAVLFNAHQHIAYGGLLGQYYLLGLGAYLRTLALYWTTVTIYLALYASAWRAGAEVLCLGTAAVAPSRAAGVRRLAEIGCALGYYAGALVILALRFVS